MPYLKFSRTSSQTTYYLLQPVPPVQPKDNLLIFIRKLVARVLPPCYVPATSNEVDNFTTSHEKGS